MKIVVCGQTLIIHNDIDPIHFVIPGLTRNPVFSWIPACVGMRIFAAINVAVYSFRFLLNLNLSLDLLFLLSSYGGHVSLAFLELVRIDMVSFRLRPEGDQESFLQVGIASAFS